MLQSQIQIRREIVLKSLLLFLLLITNIFAAPAFHGEQSFKQNDGTSFLGTLRGDEYLNWIQSDNGDVLLYNKKSKQYEYAIIKNDNLEPSGYKFNSQQALKKSPAFLLKVEKKSLLELYRIKKQKAMKKRNVK